MKINFKLILAILLFAVLVTSLAVAQDSAMKSKSVNVSKGDNLNIKLGYGDINLKTWEKNEVMVNYGLDDDENASGIELTKDGSNITLRTTDNSHIDINEIMIPSYINVDAKTDGGNINVTGELKGNFSVKTSGGNIAFQKVDGTVDIKTAGGNISSSDIGGNMEIKTAGGEVELGNISGGTIESSGGNVSIKNSSKKVDIKSGGGNISIGNVNDNISISTGGGNIDLGVVKNSANLKTGGGNIKMAGATGKVLSETGGGNVELRNVNGSVEVTSGAGDISVELTPSGKDESNIKTGQGNIDFYIPAIAKATIHVLIKRHVWQDSKDSDFIKSDFPSTTFNKSSSEINALYRINGGGTDIYLQTSEGQISINKLSK
jgi:hypothetical protein